MALRELTGTALAVLALAAAFWLSVLPASSTEILPTLAVLIGALIGAAVLQANPGTFAAATVLGWFGIMFAQPFSLSTREFNGLRRIANRGDEEAAALMAYYEAFFALRDISDGRADWLADRNPDVRHGARAAVAVSESAGRK